MNGPHDMGGRMGFGPVLPEPDEPVFHAPWEARALGLTLAVGALGIWTLDESRHARERLPWAVYLSASYYEIWIRALESLLLRHGLVTAAELAGACPDVPGCPPPPTPRPPLAAAAVAATLARGGPTDRPLTAAPRFRPGDRVRARNLHPEGHCRLPGYVRGRIGCVEADRGGHVFPDASAEGVGEAPERLYTVVFDGPELWGSGCGADVCVSVDAWESYLEPA